MSRVLWAWTSSMMAPCTLRPSSVSASAPSGSNFDAVFSMFKLSLNTDTRLRRWGELLIMRVASECAMRAWSRFVAAV